MDCNVMETWLSKDDYQFSHNSKRGNLILTSWSKINTSEFDFSGKNKKICNLTL